MSTSHDIHSLLNHPIPTFSILEHGQRKETLIHCFLQRITLDFDPANPPTGITAKNGETYSIIWDFSKPAIIASIPVIISFQKHTYGSFAIIRAVSSDEKPVEITFLSSYAGL